MFEILAKFFKFSGKENENKFKLSINGIECTGDILTLAVILISECRVAVADTDECAIPCAILIIDGVGWCHSTS